MGELVKRLVDSNRQAIVERLPRYLSETQFFAVLHTIDRNAKLAEAAQRNPESMLAAIMKIADCGLLVGTAYEHCWLIPYNNKNAVGGVEIQVQIGWHGLHYQLVRAGAVLKIDAHCVYKGDDFDIVLGDDEKLVHRPNLHDDNRRDHRWMYNKANIDGAYAVAWLPIARHGGETMKQHRWCPIGEIEAARLKSKMPDGEAWGHNYPAMAQKTAVRRVCKMIEVCGPTAENQEAWERYGRTIELDRSQYNEELQPDDDPGLKPRKSSPKSGRAAAGSEGTEHVTPPPQPKDGERKSSDAPTPPPTQEAKPEPPKAPPDEVISTERQYEILQQAAAAGMKTMAFLKHVADKFGVDLAELRQSQAAELSKYIKDMAKSAE
jgi:recombination protein RecT